MTDHQQLGGARQSSPLDDEMSYPLTQDEYLTIKENLSIDKFTNWEAFLFSTFITTIISGIVIWFSGSFYKEKIIGKTLVFLPNYFQIITVIIYGAISFGTMIGLIISVKSKTKAKSSIERLDNKIIKHLNKNNR